MKRPKKRSRLTKPDPFIVDLEKVAQLAEVMADAAIAESWKGGGDPADVEVYELRLQLARMEFAVHLEKMRRSHEPQQ